MNTDFVSPSLRASGHSGRRKEEERQQREEQIIRLREEGLSNKAIAEALGISLSLIIKIVGKLISEGRLIAQKRGYPTGLPRKGATWRDKQNERVQIIIKLKKQYATLEQIGVALGVKKERARQLTKKIAAEHGDDIFNPEEPVWTTKEAAEELKISRVTISSLCQRGEIPYRCRNALSKKRNYLLTQESMDALKSHPMVTGKRICNFCNRLFVYVKGRFKYCVCSQECDSNYGRVKHEKVLSQEPTLENLEGWHKDLWQRLKTHKPPKKERWLTLSQASDLTGLSKTQVDWLGRRRIVTVGEHPTKRWGKRPVATYAASEIKIARQAYEASKVQQ